MAQPGDTVSANPATVLSDLEKNRFIADTIIGESEAHLEENKPTRADVEAVANIECKLKLPIDGAKGLDPEKFADQRKFAIWV